MRPNRRRLSNLFWTRPRVRSRVRGGAVS